MTRCSSTAGQGRKPAPAKAATGVLTRLPPCPEHMPDAGKKEWKRTGRYLIEKGILAETDLPSFTAYCMSVGVLDMHMRGDPNARKIATLKDTTTAIRQLANDFGLSPVARARLGAEGGGGDDFSELDI